MERTVEVIEGELAEAQRQAEEIRNRIKDLRKERLKARQEAFEKAHRVRVGDTIATKDGLQVYYYGFSPEWENLPVITYKAKKNGTAGKRIEYMPESAFPC